MTVFPSVKTGEYPSDIYRFSKSRLLRKNIWRIPNIIASISSKNMFGDLFSDIICSWELTGFLELLHSPKNYSLLGTDNVRGQISERIFAPVKASVYLSRKVVLSAKCWTLPKSLYFLPLDQTELSTITIQAPIHFWDTLAAAIPRSLAECYLVPRG